MDSAPGDRSKNRTGGRGQRDLDPASLSGKKNETIRDPAGAQNEIDKRTKNWRKSKSFELQEENLHDGEDSARKSRPDIEDWSAGGTAHRSAC
jgi:hypothetical protein